MQIAQFEIFLIYDSMRKLLLTIGAFIAAMAILGCVNAGKQKNGEAEQKDSLAIRQPWEKYEGEQKQQKNAEEQQQEEEVAFKNTYMLPHQTGHAAPGFKRTEKKYVSPYTKEITSTFMIDEPEDSLESRSDIMNWLVKRITKSVREDKALLSENPPKQIYSGDPCDANGIGQAVADFFFREMHKDGGDTLGLTMYYDMDLSAMPITDSIITYIKFSYYGSGFREFRQEEAISYDIARKQEVDWDYLFKPQHWKAVETLFFQAVQKDDKFRHEHHDIETLEDVEEFFREGFYVSYDPVANPFRMPLPSLVKEGVLFSFQFEEIGCVASGAFHFVLPYKDVKPYLTEEARQSLGL